MRLAQIFEVTDWAAVREVICRCYSENMEMLAPFGSAYTQIRSLHPTDTAMQIHIVTNSDSDASGDAGINVFGKDGSFFEHQVHLPESERVEARYNLSCTKWEEWLGMEVSKDSMSRFAPSEVVAHCLWEMTYLGFSQEAIQRRVDDLNQTG